MTSNIEKAFKIFSEKYDLEHDQNIGSLELDIESGFISREGLVDEFKLLLADPNFDWVDLACSTELLVPREGEQWKNEDVVTYIKMIFWPYLFSNEYDEKNVINIRNLLKKYLETLPSVEGWVNCNGLWKNMRSYENSVSAVEDFYFYLAIWNPMYMRRPSEKCHFLAGEIKCL